MKMLNIRGFALRSLGTQSIGDIGRSCEKA